MFVRKMISNEPEYRFGIRPLDEYVTIHAGRVPNKPAILFYGTDITYGELNDAIERMASLLHSLGVKQGDTVGLYMQNCPQFVITMYAAQKLGAIVSPFSPMFKEWDLEFELNELKAKVIVANTYLYPVIRNIRKSTLLEHVILTDLKYFTAKDSPLPWTLPMGDPGPLDDCIIMMDTLKKTDIKFPTVTRDMDDTYLIMFTSGTTGLPKGAMLSYMNALYKAVALSTNHYYTEYTRMFSLQPLCHIAGLLYLHSCMYLGSSICIVSAPTPEVFCCAVQTYQLDNSYMTALFAKMVIDLPNVKSYNLSTMRGTCASSFGIQLTQALADEWSALIPGARIFEGGFGLTEGHTGDLFLPMENIVIGMHGLPVFTDASVKIVENGKEVGVGETGEIILKHKGVFKGYLNNPEATAEVIKDGWLYTGDAGMMNEDGYVTFLGRRKEMIKSSGFSVFPDEVEMYLGRHEAVDKVIVVGRVDPHRGELIKAYIVLRPEFKGKVTEEEIIEWAKDKMATYKRPREVEFRDTLPLNSTGKLMRRLIRDEEEKS